MHELGRPGTDGIESGVGHPLLHVLVRGDSCG